MLWNGPLQRGTNTIAGLSFFPQQWIAVSAPIGPHLVLAGPGAGKTRCLIGRIGFLLERCQVEADTICVITFTNKAAQEISDRLAAGSADVADRITPGTIHALCLTILRDGYHRVGLPSTFSVANEPHQRMVLSKLGVPGREQSDLLLRFGKQRLQSQALAAEDAAVFQRYQHELRSNHLIDYDEILHLTLLLLESAPGLLRKQQTRWQHLLVDEIQDLDETQYAILRLLALEHRSLFAVGDDEQSIFSWRGADPRVIERFTRDFAIERPIILDVNCRCSKTIFETARRILPARELRFDKQITAVRDSTHPVRVLHCRDEDDEIHQVLSDLRGDHDASGLSWAECAILYRTHQSGRRWEQALLAAGIPCRMAKGQALSDNPIVAQLLAALRVVMLPESDLYVEHLASKVLNNNVLLHVRRACGNTFVEKLRRYVAEKNDGTARECWRFLYQVENLKSLSRTPGRLANLVRAVFAQGLGRHDNPLEAVVDRLEDPMKSPAAETLGRALLQAKERRQRLLIAPGKGLEIIVRILLERALPDLDVNYQCGTELSANDVIVDLGDSPDLRGMAVIQLDVPGRLRITQLFKALQWIEGRRHGKIFDEYVCFDTETTGRDPARCDVIELAAVKVTGGVIVDRFHSLIHTDKPIPYGATAVHGYTNADLVGKPSLREIWPKFAEFTDNHVLIAHNGHYFDIPILERQTAAWNGMREMTFFDTLALARHLYPDGSISQESLANRFDISRGRGHHALDDAECLVEVFERMQSEQLTRSRKTCLEDLLDCIALGAAIEMGDVAYPEDQALIQVGTWNDLRRYEKIVDRYVEESESERVDAPPLRALLDHVLTRPAWRGARNRRNPEGKATEVFLRLSELVDSVEATDLSEAVRELFDKVALSTSEGPGADSDRVSLLTFHATKGLEFSQLYLIGVEDHQFPGYRALQKQDEHAMRESRRLLYVAMTRAKDKLTLTCCRERNGKPTGGTAFLNELGLANAGDARQTFDETERVVPT